MRSAHRLLFAGIVAGLALQAGLVVPEPRRAGALRAAAYATVALCWAAMLLPPSAPTRRNPPCA